MPTKGTKMVTLLRWRTRDIGDTNIARYEEGALPDGAGRAECQVVDPVGLPLQAMVTVQSAEGHAVARGGTDAYGLFCAAVPSGNYYLIVVCDGFQPYRAPVQVFSGARSSAGVIALGVEPLPPTPELGHWDIDPNHTAIRFVASHIGLAEIHGRFNRFSGSVWIDEPMRDSQVDVFIEADSIDTGAPKRDDHLRSRDFLDVSAYPYLIFSGGNFVHRGGSHWEVTGLLEMRGIVRTVKLDTTYAGLGTGMRGEARVACKAVTDLQRDDFGLTWQKMLPHGIAAIGTTIRIELDIQAVRSVLPEAPTART
ncbi:YceI family protein [Streptomyces chartreusis]|uniref:YceI family protein n=1 Tax=Streptomyces chartreusis TaxID=1969 RepID=UPI00386CB17B|nr:YceI family protein [Streptomyces chartreusis]WTA33540.1 YceI family protein [Streptomyces chartreusis]